MNKNGNGRVVDGNGKTVGPRPILFVSTPSAHLTPGYASSMEALRDVFHKKGWALGVYRETGDGIVRARNRSIEIMLSHPARPTHYACVDDDLQFDPNDIVTMIESDLDVVGGVYPKKEIDWHKVAAAVKAGVPPEKLRDVASPLCCNFEATDDEIADIAAGPQRGEAQLDAKVLKDGRGHHFVRVKDLPTGFMVCKRSVFERIRDHYGDKIAFTPSIDHVGKDMATGRDNDAGERKRHLYFHMDRYPDDPTGDYLSEDWWFCRQWQNMGGEVFAFAECRLIHHGGFAYSGCVADQLVLSDGDDKNKGPSPEEAARASQASAG